MSDHASILRELASELEEANRYASSPWHNRGKDKIEIVTHWQHDKWAKWLQRPKD